jgi:DNA-binding NtrC family response regulator
VIGRPPRVLLVEDDAGLSEVMADELEARGLEVTLAPTVAAARERIAEGEFDVAVTDLMLPDGSGLDVLRSLREVDAPTQSIMLTGYATLATALEAMKLGAYDYLTKPTRLDEIELLIGKATEKARLLWENAALRVRLQPRDAVSGLVGEDPALRKLLQDLDKVSASPLPVLIQGESGTGKELIARAVHDRSPRSAGPFVPVNCAAIPENLLESELFGHEKGAFTGALTRRPGLFEAADRGVLFLDEIGEVALPVQAKLLRAIETREFFRVGSTRPVQVDIRVVTATNKDLRTESAEGRFREDLYYRLNGVTLTLPPLRDRPGDVPLLAAHFLAKAPGKKRLSREAPGLRLARQRARAVDGGATRGGAEPGRGDRGGGAAARPAAELARGRAGSRPHPRGAGAAVHRGDAGPLRRTPRPGGRGTGDRPEDALQQARAGKEPASLGEAARVEGPCRRTPGRLRVNGTRRSSSRSRRGAGRGSSR